MTAHNWMTLGACVFIAIIFVLALLDGCGRLKP